MLWLVFDVFFFANLYVFTFSNISGSLSITRFYIPTVNCMEALAFTSFISSYFSSHAKRCIFVFSDITSSVKNIRNHVGTARSAHCKVHCPPTAAPLFLQSVPREISRHRSRLFYPSAMLSITGCIAYIGVRFVSNEQNTTP